MSGVLRDEPAPVRDLRYVMAVALRDNMPPGEVQYGWSALDIAGAQLAAIGVDPSTPVARVAAALRVLEAVEDAVKPMRSRAEMLSGDPVRHIMDDGRTELLNELRAVAVEQ